MEDDEEIRLEVEIARLKLSKAALIIDALGMVDQMSDLVKNDNGDVSGTIVYPVLTIDGAQREELISMLIKYLA